ncbi:hypothetical protein RhiirA4_453545 [Rhizophagus irregularis]|uniref:Uncharacterized protein n=1 Tax=Rhizophagus irregularis TaxID=588596 RepID=A0A2I1G0Q6_9GLOM|nr:hypothetical protein RhiirA4_453545 [Rhizophagus irregularis]
MSFINIEAPSNKRQRTENIHGKLIETIDDVEKICDFSCAYNSQTSSMNYHLNTTHKVYEKKKAEQL